MTPEEFKNKMLEIYGQDNYDVQAAHGNADMLMCDVLRQLGYSAGIDVFDQAQKWYA